jgi:diguanylate cyclase (GGDEF)-like protein
MGALASNRILVRERGLMHQLRLAAARSRNQASALSTAFARLAEAQNQLRIVNRQLETLATIDPLTGVANRRSFMEKLDAEYGLRSRYGGHFSLILLDLDHFKKVNDRHGHLVGDLVLKAATQRIRSALRSTDILGRYGGEEFVALLPQTRVAEAKIVAERIRAELSDQAVMVPEGEIIVTASLGVAEWRGPSEDAGAVLGRADRMLYVAKGGGRDRVVAEDPALGGLSHG